MKKYISLFTISLFFVTIASAQDVRKISDDFQRLMNDPKSPYGKNKVAGKYYDIRGFKMYCEVYGTGKPLLIIHGNGGSINNFVYQIPYFSKKYKVIFGY